MTWFVRLLAILKGWEILVLGPLVTVALWPATLPAWAYMWSLSVVTFFGCKCNSISSTITVLICIITLKKIWVHSNLLLTY